MNILGLNCFSHDTSACIISDSFVACVEEERLIREKQTLSYPITAVIACLRQLNLSIGDIDCVVLPLSIRHRLRKFIYSLSQFFRSGHFLPAYFDLKEARILFRRWHQGKDLLLPSTKGQVLLVEHHLAHAASAFFTSPFDEAAILTVDGIGDWSTGLLARGRGNKIEILQELVFPKSLGKFYSSVCRYLGFYGHAKEGTVMALAALGSTKYHKLFRGLFRLLPDGTFEINEEYFKFGWTLGASSEVSQRFIAKFGPPRAPADELIQKHADIASGLQYAFETIYLHLLQHLAARTHLANVCIAGGAALNSVANGKILNYTSYRDLFIQPAANDAGLALGAALWVRAQDPGQSSPQLTMRADLGPDYSVAEIKEALADYPGLIFSMPDNLVRVVAQYLADGRMVGWFQGRMEFGPRALGNRSILADPRKEDSRTRVNRIIKEREFFRPCAATILAERATEFFPTPLPYAARYMLTVHELFNAYRSYLPAITHEDGTCRLQILEYQDNMIFYQLIQEFERITGIPLVLNTSFNRRDEPLVCSPKDAIQCYLNTDIDILAIGPLLVRRQ